MAKLSGGCVCGGVRYESDAAPKGTMVWVCHCTHCQKNVGIGIFGRCRRSGGKRENRA
jgi:hypothetical protein